MEASSSCNQKCDVFPSFRGEDVRRGFLSHLLEALDRSGSINIFKDHGIERSRQISLELLSAIKEARISIVIFSKNYASSTWCLDELTEIHHSYKVLKQMVIPIFYDVDPSQVRKQTGEFGESFRKTCEGQTDVVKERWKQALTDVASLAGEHLQNWSDEASMVKKIATDVSNKLISLSNGFGFGDFVGIEAHIEAIESKMCLESKDIRMIGIWGLSGIGKSTLGRALFSYFSPKFPLHAFLTYKTTDQNVFGMKLFWEKQFLAEILNTNIKENRFGMVEQMLKDKKVLIILDDVVSVEFLETLVRKTEWFGPGSRIFVISQDKHLLWSHMIVLYHEMKIPDDDIALKMLCQSAFGETSPPEGFKELAVEAAKVVCNLPLGLSILGSSLRGRTTEEWKEFLAGLQKGMKGDIVEIIRVGYDRLDKKEQEIFLWIAYLFNGKSVKSINDFFEDNKDGVKRLAEKSLIRITINKNPERLNEEIVEMHRLLEVLGRQIVRAESKGNPQGKRRFLRNAEEVRDVLTSRTDTEAVIGIYLGRGGSINKKSLNEITLKGMCNLQFLEMNNYDLNRSRLPHCIVDLRKLKYLHWKYYPLKCLPSNFKTECLVELRMEFSKLEKLWEGTKELGNLKTIIMRGSKYLKEIPDLSTAINLKRVDFSHCSMLEGSPDLSNARYLETADFSFCDKLESLGSPLNWESP